MLLSLFNKFFTFLGNFVMLFSDDLQFLFSVKPILILVFKVKMLTKIWA